MTRNSNKQPARLQKPRTLREHLQIYKKLSKAMLYEAGIMAISLCLKSVANKFFFAIFMLALIGLVFTVITSLVYSSYLEKKFGKAARRVFLPVNKQSTNSFSDDLITSPIYKNFSTNSWHHQTTNWPRPW